MEACSGYGGTRHDWGTWNAPQRPQNMIKYYKHGGRCRSLTESMHTGIGAYSQKSTGDVALREHPGILLASQITGGYHGGWYEKETSAA